MPQEATQYPDAPDSKAAKAAPADARRPPQAKSQAEFDAYKAAAALTDPAKLEAAATDFAQRFPASELRSILFQQAMGLFQRANDPGKSLEMARAALKFDPENPVALLAAAQVLVERTSDSDLDRNDRLAESQNDAHLALQSAAALAPPANFTPEQIAAALAEIRGTAHEVLATVAFKKQDYPTAIQQYELTTAEEKEHTDAVVWLRLAVAYDRSGDYARATPIAKKAIAAAEPGSPVRQLAEEEASRLEKLSAGAANSTAK
jgi:tetratricopeptide (TPR) repeat protein